VLRLRQDARGRDKLTPPWEGPFIITKILKPGHTSWPTIKARSTATLGTSDSYVAFTLKMFSSRSYTSFSIHTQIKSNRQGRVSLASAKPDPPSGARRGEPPLRQNFPRKRFLPKRLSCFPTISITKSCKTSKSARKRQGRPSRGTPTPQGYGYLTRHLPRKVTLARMSDSATDEQVQILKTRGKETQIYNMTIRCIGLGGREKHMHAPNRLLR
jgi:hypothetical protein